MASLFFGVGVGRGLGVGQREGAPPTSPPRLPSPPPGLRRLRRRGAPGAGGGAPLPGRRMGREGWSGGFGETFLELPGASLGGLKFVFCSSSGSLALFLFLLCPFFGKRRRFSGLSRKFRLVLAVHLGSEKGRCPSKGKEYWGHDFDNFWGAIKVRNRGSFPLTYCLG